MSSMVEKPPSKHQACGIHGNDGLESLQTDTETEREFSQVKASSRS